MTNLLSVVEIGSTHYSLLANIGRATSCHTEVRKNRRDEGNLVTTAVLADREVGGAGALSNDYKKA